MPMTRMSDTQDAPKAEPPPSLLARGKQQHSMSETLIREYYTCFNERRFTDAVKLFTEDAVLEHNPFGRQHRGKDGYIRFAQAWDAAFPDGTLVVERIDRRTDTMFDGICLAGRGLRSRI